MHYKDKKYWAQPCHKLFKFQIDFRHLVTHAEEKNLCYWNSVVRNLKQESLGTIVGCFPGGQRKQH